MKTLGEKRVRVEFNPSKGEIIQDIKQATATLIDLLEGFRLSEPADSTPNPELQRLISIAQTEYENAAMWAVKAVTTEHLQKN
jgi:hypothetical protein